jgi:isoleucyl-tRNA synthetase
VVEVFKPAGNKPSYPALEAAVLRFWRENDVFAESIRSREGAPAFRFYEGPPTANGRPHVAHMLPRVYKDVFPRYRTMAGYQVLRKAGWDTHGLPVELEVEKELGISGKPAIEEYGIERFNAKSKESVWRYLADWEEGGTVRLGYWLDLENAYVTYTNDYIESVWWALRALWDKGLLYRGHKIVPYCPRCGTSLSSHEVAQGYEQAEDPSVFVRFGLDHLLGEPVAEPTSLLVWTTTPWTLPSNVAVAVSPGETYVLIELALPDASERVVMAKGALDNVFGSEPDGDSPARPYRILAEFPGSELVGTSYRPPFSFIPRPVPSSGQQAWVALPAEFVLLDEGTGIVHLAPAFGEDDYQMGRLHNLPFFQPIDTAGRFTELVPNWQGEFVKDADEGITANLKERGLLFRAGRYEHTYPFCWRCDAPLLYYARESWFIRTTAHKERLIELNRQINWLPGHLREGRFGNFLDNLVDWNLSRERYWGSPLPIWICEAEGCDHQHCVGSYAELAALATKPLAEPFDPHRPFVDDIKLRCAKCGGEMQRVPHVIDCWFESGSMPFAQYHYPFENQELFESMFPADYISEAIDQTRGWFYSLHAIAAMLFDKPSYLTCLCTEHGVDADGHKMSKSRGNVIPPSDFYNRQGADALRWFLVAGSPAWTVKRFDHNAVTDVQNQVLDTLYNVFAFFTLYASIDGYNPADAKAIAARPAPAHRPALDRWLLSRLTALTAESRARLDGFDATGTARLMAEFIDDLSNWYVRRGRKRYWKAEDDQDKSAAHWTLFEALRTLTKLMAPIVPFVTEHIYQALRLPGEPLSVHLCDYPAADEALRDIALETQMATCRRLVGLGRAARNRTQIRTRQPLPEIVVSGARLGAEVEAQLLEELNVKAARYDDQAGSYVSYQLKLNFERVGKRLGKLTPAAAKALGELDAATVAARVTAGHAVELALADEQVRLEPADVVVRTQEREGFAVERDGALQIALSTAVSPELLWEGLAREVINRIQRARKDAGLEVADRIVAHLATRGTLGQALAAHRAHIAREVLADELTLAETAAGAGGCCGPADAYRADLDVEGEQLTVLLARRE